MTAKLYIESLGCQKNQVDTEVIIGRFLDRGYLLTNHPEDADIIILNSCAFLQSAREESIERLFELHHARNNDSTLILSGCLPQLYPEISSMIPELNAVTGIDDIPRIVEIAEQSSLSHISDKPSYIYTARDPRVIMNSAHTAFVKIADGCNNGCAYCSIPVIRGSWRERGEEDILAETKALLSEGFKELVLIAQDTTFYGRKRGLLSLLRGIDALPYNFRLRLLYFYPSKVSEELLKTIRDSRHIVPYLDIPLQHISDRVLAKMNRHYRSADVYRLLEKIENIFGDKAVLRTTFITGFPGEREKDFKQLIDFINKDLFDYAGIFAYSKEEKTAAYAMRRPPLQRSSERYEEASHLLSASIRRRLSRFIGQRTRVLFERIEEDSLLPLGRTDEQSPDVDGETIITNLEPHHKPGDFIPVVITGLSDTDFIAEISKKQ